MQAAASGHGTARSAPASGADLDGSAFAVAAAEGAAFERDDGETPASGMEATVDGCSHAAVAASE
eukprot:3267538-Pyramimonas_sp.AAC.1